MRMIQKPFILIMPICIMPIISMKGFRIILYIGTLDNGHRSECVYDIDEGFFFWRIGRFKIIRIQF